MASCMECIHFNPCNMHEKIIVEKPTDGNDWGLHNQVENECKYFTPTADVVEVVRCKDCKKWTKEHTCKEFTADRSPLRGKITFVTEPTDFCSYGERK